MNKKERQIAYERERKAMNDLAMREFDRERAIEAIHKEHIETIQEQIDGFYMRYAGSEGLTRSEAMKRADQMDVTKFANKAKKAVKEKDFSPETNEWLKTYNLKMKVSRLELLKEEVNWELIQMYDKDYQLISESLREEARLELERQAGILGDSAKGASKRINGIVNSDFYGKNFSERIWDRTGMYQTTQKEVYKSLSRIYTTMDGYRNERNRLMDKMQTTEYETMRLLRTENARIGSQMQVEAYKANEFTHFIYVAEPGACDICGPLDGKIFPVSEAQIGLNLKPLHPNCRCSSHGYIAMERLVDGEWVDEMTGEKVESSEEVMPKPLNKTIIRNLDDDAIDFYTEKLQEMPNDVKGVWNKYSDDIVLTDSKSRVNGHNRGEVRFNARTDLSGSEFYEKGDTFFHEFGHNIDYLAGGRTYGSSFTEQVKLSNGKNFGETIYDEVQNMLKAEPGKASDKRSSLYKKLMADYENDPKSMAVISDVYGGATNNVLSLGIGHKKTYWQPAKTRSFTPSKEDKENFRNKMVGREGFAGMFAADANNSVQVDMLKKWMPESYKAYKEILTKL